MSLSRAQERKKEFWEYIPLRISVTDLNYVGEQLIRDWLFRKYRIFSEPYFDHEQNNYLFLKP